jgi:hypothetical protein
MRAIVCSIQYELSEIFIDILSEVTRTTPVGNGGKFTKEAREIYSLVLKMQKVGINLHQDIILGD